MNKTTEITIDIFGQSFTIRAEPEEEKNLQLVAHEVNDFLHKMSRKGTVAIHRLALMAAFQYAYELDTLKNAKPGTKMSSQMNKRLDRILSKLQKALEEE